MTALFSKVNINSSGLLAKIVSPVDGPVTSNILLLALHYSLLATLCSRNSETMAKSSFFLLVFLATTAFAQEYGTNYNAGDHGRSETVGPDGEVQGQYQYTDPEGKLITVKYRAGKEGFQVEGDHLPRAPQPGPPGPSQQQPQQPFYNPQQYQQPQQFQPGQYQPQPQQQPQFNPFFNQQQPQVQPQASLFQNFGQPQFQGHPNALPGQFQQQPQAQPQFFTGQEQPGQRRPATVMVSQQPGAGFMYSLQT